MDILITGGSGFIGRNLVEYLSLKHKVAAPSHAELELLDEDAVKGYFKSRNFDTVIHAAIRPGHRNAKDPSNELYQNARMFFNLIRNSSSFKKIIVLSSGLVYDQRFYIPKMKEEYLGTHMPADEGGFSKYIIAKYIGKMDNAVELRVFGIFGKYEDYAIRFISNAICKTIFDLPITIKQNRKFDYVYIEDFLRITEHFLQNSGKYRSYNITPDRAVDLYELAKTIRKISGKDFPIKVAREGMGLEYSGDNARLRQEMPVFKFMPVEAAIEKLYAWYSENKSSINKEFLLFDK
ncbi:MAG: NAD(P)-dependent oxidoreductase [Candidatus Omnitrophota bacterium]